MIADISPSRVASFGAAIGTKIKFGLLDAESDAAVGSALLALPSLPCICRVDAEPDTANRRLRLDLGKFGDWYGLL